MKWIEDKKSKKWDLLIRNGAKKRFGKSSYLSWILHKTAPFSEETKVYTLPQIEYKFWEKMKDPTTGYLRIHSKGADQARFFSFCCYYTGVKDNFSIVYKKKSSRPKSNAKRKLWHKC